MSTVHPTKLAEILARREGEILDEWLRHQREARGQRGLDRETTDQSRRFLEALHTAVASGPYDGFSGRPWADVRDVLTTLSETRARQGYTAAETTTFVFSLKQPLFTTLQHELSRDPNLLADESWRTTTLLDQLGLYTMEVFQRGREEVIARQQQDMLELSTPVVTLWDGILALPVIGTLDSARTQIVMENLLQRIVETGAELAIIDITGVPTVDTLVAQHLLKTVAAARLMGADCIISGIRPQIAQTIVHLGVDLGNVITKATLADAFALALQRRGLSVTAAMSGGAGKSRPAEKGESD